MAEANVKDTDWREARQAELQVKGNRVMAEINQLLINNGLILRAVIVPRNNGETAEARITIDFAP